MTTLGKVVLTLLILGAAGLGAYKWWDRLNPAAVSGGNPAGAGASTAAKDGGDSALNAADFVAPLDACPLLPPAAAYVAKDNIVDLELSEYAGYSGIIVAENESTVTIRGALGVENTIDRANIDRMTSASLSLMPEELEKVMTRQEMRDLIGFLKGE